MMVSSWYAYWTALLMLSLSWTTLRSSTLAPSSLIALPSSSIVQCAFNSRCACDMQTDEDDDDEDEDYDSVTVVTGASCTHIPYNIVEDIPGSTIFFQLYIRDTELIFLGDDHFQNIRAAVLSLKRNRISNISGSSLRGLEQPLSSLDLSQNYLTHISDLTFNRIYNLQWLSLHDNYISSVTEFSWGSISSTLRTLYLGRNRIHTLPSNAFLYFPNLSTLSLDSNLLTSSQHKFPPNITTLNLSGNFLTVLPKGIFSLQSISWLLLKDNLIQSLPSEAVTDRHVTLNELDLSSNFIINLPYNTFGRKLRVRFLNLDFNFLREIPGQAFTGLYPQKLTLSHNLIVDINDLAFQGLGSYLFTLDLSFNRIKHIPRTLQHLKHLTELDLQGNRIALVPSNAFAPFITKLTTLILSNNRLDQLPSLALDGASSLTHLDVDYNRLGALGGVHESWGKSLGSMSLRGNNLRQFQDGIFTLTPHLHTLKISWNSFEKLQSRHLAPYNRSLIHLEISNCLTARPGEVAHVISGLISLEELIMDGNNLSVLPVDIFTRMKNLRHVDLRWNGIKALPSILFRSNVHSKLKYIDVSFNRLTKLFSGTFHGLSSLEHVILFGNHIVNISTAAFHNLPKLRVVVVTFNQLSMVNVGAFSYVPKLRKVALQHNKLGVFCLDIFGEKVGTDGRPLTVNASRNQITDIQVYCDGKDQPDQEEGFRPLSKIYVTLLDLSHNLILVLPEKFFSGLRYLTELILRDNLIVSLDPKVFLSQSNLMYLDLSKNRLSYVPTNALRSLTNVRVIRMSQNMAEQLKHRFSPLRRLRVLDLSSNNLRQIHNVSLRRTNVEKVILDWNLLTSVPSSCLRSVSSTITSLHLSHNRIYRLLPGTFKSMVYLHTLDLSHNVLETIPENSFQFLTRLVHLHLSHNPLKALPEKLLSGLDSLHVLELANTSLSQLPNFSLRNLRSLNLAHNRFTHLPTPSFQDLWNLQELNLSHNDLIFVPNHLWPAMPTLNTLDISYNPVTALTVSTFIGLNRLLDLDIRHLRLKKFDSRTLSALPIIRTLKLSSYPQVKSFHFHNLLNNIFTLKRLFVEIQDVKLSHQLRWAFGPKLEELFVTGSNLRELTDDIFEGVENRHRLTITITQTSVQKLPSNFLNHLRAMKSVVIDLSGNKLQSLAESVFFPQDEEDVKGSKNILKGLFVHDNPDLICDCRLTWLTQVLRTWIRLNIGPSKSRRNADDIDEALLDVVRATCRRPEERLKSWKHRRDEPIIMLDNPTCSSASSKSTNHAPFLYFTVILFLTIKNL